MQHRASAPQFSEGPHARVISVGDLGEIDDDACRNVHAGVNEHFDRIAGEPTRKP